MEHLARVHGDRELQQPHLAGLPVDFQLDGGGMRTLAEDGWRLVRMRVTTVEEVLSVTTAKEVARTTKIEQEESAEQTPHSVALSRK